MPYGPQTLWPDHCVQGTPGAGFHPKLLTDRAGLVIRKGFRRAIDSYSAFYENDRRHAHGSCGLSARARLTKDFPGRARDPTTASIIPRSTRVAKVLMPS